MFKKPLTLILAGQNQHKLDELQQFLSPEFQLIKADSKIEVLEDGQSYYANALKKAEAYYKRFKSPVLSDDSGLEIRALPNQLGVDTAHFGGAHLNASQRNEKILELLLHVPWEERQATFKALLCCYLSPGQIYFFEGSLEGRIAPLAIGPENSFGQNPIFVPEGWDPKETLALHPEWKDQHSHRRQAVEQLKLFFKGQWAD